MEVSPGPNGSLIFDQLDPFMAEILRQIPDAADPSDDENALARLTPPPLVDAGSDSDFLEDWNEYVRPELRALFRASIEVVAADLARMDTAKKPGEWLRLVIPAKHTDAWLNALNQARIVLAERHRFTEEELETCTMLSFESRRDLALVQMNFYAGLQDFLLHHIEKVQGPFQSEGGEG